MAQAKVRDPIRYGTFPPLKEPAAEYIQALGNAPVKVLAIDPGDKLEF